MDTRCCSSLFGDVSWYEFGRLRGGRVLNLLCRISLEPDSCVRKTEDAFVRHGSRSLLIAKFVPGLNTMAPPLAGIIGMRLAPDKVDEGHNQIPRDREIVLFCT